MRLDNLDQSTFPGIAVKDGFKLKDGLFEYSKNLLGDSERHAALRWIEQQVPPLDEDLRKFMRLSERPDESTERKDLTRLPKAT